MTSAGGGGASGRGFWWRHGAGRAMQLRIADGERFDAYGGSFVPSLSFGRDWPRLNGRARDLWRMVGGPAPPAGRGTGTGSF